MPESAVTTTAVSWFNPSERQSGRSAEVLGDGASQSWAFLTGLDGPTSNRAWQERLEAACAAPIWEYAAAVDLAVEFVEADGGEAADAVKVNGAVDALQLMLRQQVRIRSDASDDPMDGTLMPIHACE